MCAITSFSSMPSLQPEMIPVKGRIVDVSPTSNKFQVVLDYFNQPSLTIAGRKATFNTNGTLNLSEKEKNNFIPLNIVHEGTKHTILLNLRSTSKQLGLPLSHLKEVISKGNCAHFLSSLNKEYVQTFHNIFKNILSLNNYAKGVLLRSKRDGFELGINDECLSNVIGFSMSPVVPNGVHLIPFSGTNYVVSKDNGLLMDLLTTHQAKSLGKGAVGEVFQLRSLASEIKAAFKTLCVKTEKIQKAIKELQNSNIKLGNIFKQYGEVSGIPKPSHLVKTLSPGVESTLTGILMEAFDGDFNILKKHPDFQNPEKAREVNKIFVLAAWQLLHGLVCLEEEGIVHGDIKPENILVQNLNGKWKFCLNDFDGAKYLKNKTNGEISIQIELDVDFGSSLGTSFTSNYVLQNDFERLRKLLRERNNPSYILTQHQRDLFALGLSLFEMCTRDLVKAYALNTDKYRSTPTTLHKEQLIGFKFHPEFAAIVEQMLHPSARHRGNAKNLLERLHQTIFTYYPDVFSTLPSSPFLTIPTLSKQPSSLLPSQTLRILENSQSSSSSSLTKILTTKTVSINSTNSLLAPLNESPIESEKTEDLLPKAEPTATESIHSVTEPINDSMEPEEQTIELDKIA